MFRANSNALPVGAYDTYGLRQRPAARNRRATCAEVACWAFLNGFRTVINAGHPDREAALFYLRQDRTRRPVEIKDMESARVMFEYPPGTTCFGEHWIEMEQLYLVRGGDHRGTTRPVRRHTRAEFWVEEFGENQERLSDRAARG